MDAKLAISQAKQHFQEVYSGEGVSNIGLEEVRYNEDEGNWLITLGFSWSWDLSPSLASITGRSINAPRFYKVVRVKDLTGELVSVTNRNLVGE